MAKVVTEVPKFGEKYDKFFDGQPWRLELGVDCPADLRVAQNSLRVTAKRRGIECTIRQSKADNCIYVQAKVKPAKKRKPR